MTVKALTLLAFSLTLAILPEISCCQAAKSYGGEGGAGAYKQDRDNCSIERSQISRPPVSCPPLLKTSPDSRISAEMSPSQGKVSNFSSPHQPAGGKETSFTSTILPTKNGQPPTLSKNRPLARAQRTPQKTKAIFKSLTPVMDTDDGAAAIAPDPSVFPADPSLAYRGLTADTVMAALRASKFAALEQGADVRFEGETLFLSLFMPGAVSEHNQRVDTVLLAQAIDQHFHGVFERVSCSFHDGRTANLVHLAQLNLGQLALYGHGHLTDQQLLSAVELSNKREESIGQRYQGLAYKQILEQCAVSAGAYSSERKEILDQLTIMAANGYDVGQATRQFLALEDLVRTRQYSRISQAIVHARQCLARSAAKAQAVSVATSRTENWQR